MIDPSAYIFYLGYGVLCIVAILAQIKVQSTEMITITTPEFKSFQWNFLMGYLASILGEILSVASFYSTLLTISLNNEQITHLFVISILATTIFSLLIEIIDFGSKRTKCILSAVLFALASLTLFSSHYDILILGRILYGGGSVLLHSGFDSYLIHEHNSQGFPDDWLNNTFGRLVHSMVIVTMLSGPSSLHLLFLLTESGVLGQYVFSIFGPRGNLIFLTALFLLIVLFISNQWTADIAAKRFLLNGFFQTVGQSVRWVLPFHPSSPPTSLPPCRAIRANSQTALVIALSSCVEATILVFSFYWAPWFAGLSASAATGADPVSSSSIPRLLEEMNTPASALPETLSLVPSPDTVSPLPLVLIYSSLMTVAMVGHYLHTLALPVFGNDHIFLLLLFIALVGYLLAAVLALLSSAHSPSTTFFLALILQLCSGAYWPCIGFLRGKFILPEIRGVVISFTR
jgi:hypothetical protein